MTSNDSRGLVSRDTAVHVALVLVLFAVATVLSAATLPSGAAPVVAVLAYVVVVAGSHAYLWLRGEDGDVPVFVGWDGHVQGAIGVGDSPRTAWESVVETVGADRRVVVLTGDEGPDAERLRAHPAVETVFAGVPPDGKAETIRRLAATDSVAMVGDGSNDAPALAAADVGIALESGTQLATDAADAIVLDGDLRSVPAVFDIASHTNRRIKENIAWAFCYNAVAIPLAVAGLINPLFAAVAMAASSLLVVSNSRRPV